MEEFRRLSFEGMADELEDPADYEQRKRQLPKAGNERNDRCKEQGEDDHRNTDGVANTVDRILMAACVLCDPVIPGSAEKHRRLLHSDVARLQSLSHRRTRLAVHYLPLRCHHRLLGNHNPGNQVRNETNSGKQRAYERE